MHIRSEKVDHAMTYNLFLNLANRSFLAGPVGFQGIVDEANVRDEACVGVVWRRLHVGSEGTKQAKVRVRFIELVLLFDDPHYLNQLRATSSECANVFPYDDYRNECDG
jgi:hypothetical protein